MVKVYGEPVIADRLGDIRGVLLEASGTAQILSSPA